ncbi:MAG TPA: hypothetical protein DEO88_04020 [Syntrophobacteraceae bacterium]|nr:hypothetical protein [Syntrophobacteraceae bacterium]
MIGKERKESMRPTKNLARCGWQIVCIGILILVMNTVSLAKEFSGVNFADQVTIGQQTCKLVGVGMRKKFVVDVYCGALYMTQPTQDPQQVIAAEQPKRVLLHVVYKQVEPHQWVEGWQEGFAKNTPSPDAALKDKIDQFLKCFTETVKKGQEVQITYVPDKGTEVMVNQQVKATILGSDFMKALWSIWFGKQPASESLMKGMLGK